jgi:predicted amidophosphoribosyltransferase
MPMRVAEASWLLLGRLSGALASVIFPSDGRIGESLQTTVGPYRPVLTNADTPSSSEILLDYEDRLESVRGAFALKEGGRVDNSRILLLDNVMTTGATLDACSRALADAGASSVIALTVARAVRPASPAGR